MSFPNVSISSVVGFLTPIGPRKINEIPLDVVIEESVEHAVEITKHPIEVASGTGFLGGERSDNLIVKPDVYTMRGGVSDFPVTWRVFSNPYANATAETRSISAYQILRKHIKEGIIFDLDTPPFGILKNMVFETFRVNRDASTKNAMVFTATIRQLQIVVPDPVLVEKTSDQVSGDQAQTQAISENKRGLATGKTVEAPTGSVLGNILKTLSGGNG